MSLVYAKENSTVASQKHYSWAGAAAIGQVLILGIVVEMEGYFVHDSFVAELGKEIVGEVALTLVDVLLLNYSAVREAEGHLTLEAFPTRKDR